MIISVAISTYNGSKFILEQLNSILYQTLTPDEVIICDDCSKDDTVPIIHDFIRKNNLSSHWVLYKNEKNIGYIENFRKAISLTTGDIIFLSDQDDIFYNNKFEYAYNCFKKNKDIHLLNLNYEYIDENAERIKSIRTLTPKRRKLSKLTFERLLYNSNYPGFSMAFTKKIRDLYLSQNLSYCYGHDILLNVLAASINGCYESNEVLTKYRIHSMNTSNVNDSLHNNRLNSRINQKEQEYDEYNKLIQLIEINNIQNINIRFINDRIGELTYRLNYLKYKRKLKAIFFILKRKTYPIHTILGDIVYLFKER